VAGLAWLEEQAGRLDLLGEWIQRALSQARLEAGEHAQPGVTPSWPASTRSCPKAAQGSPAEAATVIARCDR